MAAVSIHLYESPNAPARVMCPEISSRTNDYHRTPPRHRWCGHRNDVRACASPAPRKQCESITYPTAATNIGETIRLHKPYLCYDWFIAFVKGAVLSDRVNDKVTTIRACARDVRTKTKQHGKYSRANKQQFSTRRSSTYYIHDEPTSILPP
ncbi:unnamed protein product, partial [Ectocarpus sp. 12 AP-2014]